MVLVVITCIVGREYQVRCVDKAIASLNEMASLSRDDMISASDNLDGTFDRDASVLQLYMNHADIESVKNAIVTLHSAIRYRDETEIMAAVEYARAQLLKLRDIDAAQIKNVL